MNTFSTPEEKITGLDLPPAPKPAGVYKPVVIAGRYVYVSGQVPVQPDGSLLTGRVGDSLTLEEGKLAARQAGLTMLATLKVQLGDLNRIRRLIKTLGMVNCTPEFAQHPAVINGFSELMIEVFGSENGVGARSAIGAMLPMQVAVEVEAVFELIE